MKILPADVARDRRMPEFTDAIMPIGMRRKPATKAGVQARIRVAQGLWRYRIGVHISVDRSLSPEHPGIVEPEGSRDVELPGPVRFGEECWPPRANPSSASLSPRSVPPLPQATRTDRKTPAATSPQGRYFDATPSNS